MHAAVMTCPDCGYVFPRKGTTTSIDIRIGNQYVVVPPSVLENRHYRWHSPLVSAAELPPLPKPWIDHFLPHRKVP